MQDFRPIPLARVDAAALGQIVLRRSGRLRGDLGRLGSAGVVLPQPGLRRRDCSANFGFKASGVPSRSTGIGVRPGRVHADADDLFRLKAGMFSGVAHRRAHGLINALDVVRRVLPGQVRVFRVEQDALFPARVVVDRGCDFRAVVHVHDERARRWYRNPAQSRTGGRRVGSCPSVAHPGALRCDDCRSFFCRKRGDHPKYSFPQSPKRRPHPPTRPGAGVAHPRRRGHRV